ncbi:MAG TPA: UDP-N-acetylmuramoyl-L-alanyl-D-glutamate--2,6-diaminopimelate ligase [Candidatus Babeliaceae bacterium]|nr:UDP-N-acetylmuramoyl-L-alanyl-D-glutamate--2,6-diaminopimelate ligase [Candidatus Babeliaceae bacterium]
MSLISQIFPVACHTDHIGPGSTFVAIQGMREDGIRYIPQALYQGATRIVVQSDREVNKSLLELICQYNAELIIVENSRKALAELSAQAAGYPAHRLKIIGVTGTKGKTTTSFLLEHILKSAGYSTALISTAKNCIKGTDMPTALTTPQSDYLQVFLKACVQQSVEWVVMEVAAQALSLFRVWGIEFVAGIYTNFSQEHGEFYDTQDSYFAAKVKLIEQISPNGYVILNQDDQRLSELKPFQKTVRFGFSSQSEKLDQNFYKITDGPTGLAIKTGTFDVKASNLLGNYNAYNVAAAVTCALSLNIPLTATQQACSSFKGAPGRLDKYQLPNGSLGVIDYAHNPASYEAVLSTLSTYTSHLIVVFGAGGERDSTRRPLMGAIASRYAQAIVLTSDNPRSEQPETIINDILQGISSDDPKVYIELDREQAIKKAYTLSDRGSIIVLLGKGPEEYQLINGVKYPFSEAKILASLV